LPIPAGGIQVIDTISEQPTTNVASIVQPEDTSMQPQINPPSPRGQSLTFINQSHGHNSTCSTKSPGPREIVPSESPIPFMGEASPGAQNNCSTILSPLSTPGSVSNGFVSATPMSGYEEFAVSSNIEDEQSPQFMMDWSTFQFSPTPIDPMARQNLLLSPGMAGIIPFDTLRDPNILPMASAYSVPLDPLNNPTVTPRLSTSTSRSEFEFCSSSSVFGGHTRDTSYSESGSPNDILILVKAQDGWNSFRSGPILPPDMCPKTARAHIEKLEHSLKDQEKWGSWELPWLDMDTTNEHLELVSMDECSREKLMAITQSFLHKALEIHQNSTLGSTPRRTSFMPINSNFILLPTTRVLNYFFRAYVNTFEQYFPVTPQGTLNLNRLLMNNQVSDRASSLLALLMIAAGALYVPSMDARWLNGGLIEACRISLFNLVETNISMASDHTLLHSALLFVSTAAWSGDKWHMDIAMGQKGMYTAMLRHSGALEMQQRQIISPHVSTEERWTNWLQNESRNR
jgi:hypothetical protein